MKSPASILVLFTLAACTVPLEEPVEAELFDQLSLTVIADAEDGLDQPTDLAFNPDRPDELWVVNQGSQAMVVLFGAGRDGYEAEEFAASGNQHFLARPSGLAFSDNGNLATIHETNQPTQGDPASGGTPADFMGPTLWSSDLSIFDGGHAGHIDMLHNSPNGMGVAAEGDNVFWVFDGAHSSLTRYDFREDHGPGGAYHGDGIIHRYVEGEVSRRAGVPSNLVFDASSDLLYVADTGGRRIAALDTLTGEPGSTYGPNYDGVVQRRVDGAELWTLVDGAAINLRHASGLALRDGLLYVTDNANGNLLAFDLDGALVDWIDTGRGEEALMGLAFDANGVLHLVDGLAEEVLRVDL